MACDVDCDGSWSGWTTCVDTCGITPTQTRTFSIKTGKRGDGQSCFDLAISNGLQEDDIKLMNGLSVSDKNKNTSRDTFVITKNCRSNLDCCGEEDIMYTFSYKGQNQAISKTDWEDGSNVTINRYESFNSNHWNNSNMPVGDGSLVTVSANYDSNAIGKTCSTNGLSSSTPTNLSPNSRQTSRHCTIDTWWRPIANCDSNNCDQIQTDVVHQITHNNNQVGIGDSCEEVASKALSTYKDELSDPTPSTHDMIKHSDTEFRYTNAGQCSRDPDFTCPNPTCKLDEFKLQIKLHYSGIRPLDRKIDSFNPDQCSVYLLNVYKKNSDGKKERRYDVKLTYKIYSDWWVLNKGFEYYFDKNKPLYICFIREITGCTDNDCNGRNLIYKLSLYENIRDQIIEEDKGIDTGNTLDMRVAFVSKRANGYQVSPYIPYNIKGSFSSQTTSYFKVNEHSEHYFYNLDDINTQRSWSLYLLPDMYYREAAGTDDWRSTKPIMRIHTRAQRDLMYGMGDNGGYYHMKQYKKIHYMREAYGDLYNHTNIPIMLREYYDLWIKHFDNITMPMMMGILLHSYSEKTPRSEVLSFNLEDKEIYYVDDTDVNDGTQLRPWYDGTLNRRYYWWRTETVNNLYDLFLMNTKYEDMDQEVYPTNVKAYKTEETSDDIVSLERLIDRNANSIFFTHSETYHL